MIQKSKERSQNYKDLITLLSKARKLAAKTLLEQESTRPADPKAFRRAKKIQFVKTVLDVLVGMELGRNVEFTPLLFRRFRNKKDVTAPKPLDYDRANKLAFTIHFTDCVEFRLLIEHVKKWTCKASAVIRRSRGSSTNVEQIQVDDPLVGLLVGGRRKGQRDHSSGESTAETLPKNCTTRTKEDGQQSSVGLPSLDVAVDEAGKVRSKMPWPLYDTGARDEEDSLYNFPLEDEEDAESEAGKCQVLFGLFKIGRRKDEGCFISR